jgi:GxxExxY protein
VASRIIALAEQELTGEINRIFFRVYNKFGFGFVETPYVLAMERELRAAGFNVAREASVRLYYDGVELCQYRLDLVVNGKVLIEIKACERLHPAHRRQVMNYLRATSLEVGLLLHFGPTPKFERFYCPNSTKPQFKV